MGFGSVQQTVGHLLVKNGSYLAVYCKYKRLCKFENSLTLQFLSSFSPLCPTSSANLEREDAAFVLLLTLCPSAPLMYMGVQTGEKDSISTNNYLIITIQLHLVDQEAITETN
jgi:hypothetical protein